MQVTGVRILKAEPNEEGIVAFADIILDEAFVVNGLYLIPSETGDLMIGHLLCYPVDDSVNEEICLKVIAAYEES